jgi:hypothetical protein
MQVQQGEPFGDECLIHVKEMTMQREVELEVRINLKTGFRVLILSYGPGSSVSK